MSWILSPQNWLLPEISDGDLIWKEALCRCNSLRSSRWDHSQFTWGPKFNEWCLNKDKRTQKEGDPVKMEVEIGVTLPQAKECLGSLEAESGKQGFLPEVFRASMALLTPWFQTPGFQNYERLNLGSFSHTVGGTLSWQP